MDRKNMLSVNEYFAGKVKSIGFENGSLGRSSVGVMEAGEYNFSTAQPEEMTVIAGSLNVMLPGATEWVVFGVGDSFLVMERVSLPFRFVSRRPIFAAICKSKKAGLNKPAFSMTDRQLFQF